MMPFYKDTPHQGEYAMQTQPNLKTALLTASGIAFLMLLTRGSHVLTSVSLPDASIVLFLLGGLYLRKFAWFAAFFILATVIDFGAAAFDPAQGFCLTDGYWGLIPAYGVMWLGGWWLSRQQAPFALLRYSLVALLTSVMAFIISTQTYYLYSGRFPAEGLFVSMQHGWEYLSSWMTYAVMYFAIVWLAHAALRLIKPLQTAKI